VIVSDSGGVQEEAPSLDVPVLVLRETTERPDGIEAGGAILCGVHPDGMRQHLDVLLADQEVHRRMARSVNPYGDGHAARRIVQLLARALGADESVRTDPVNAI
jgi:UDP-N-acetylglucosamine 2-epimerase (non-hydrolysing)